MEFLWAPKRDTENNRTEPPLHLSWCGNFVDLPETLRKLRLSTNFPHQEIWWKYCILHSALPAWLNFCNPCFRRFSYICIYWNTVLLMIMSQNWGYESRFDVIISSQPYWNYHGFLSPLGNWCLGEQKKIPGLPFARGDQYSGWHYDASLPPYDKWNLSNKNKGKILR